MEGDPAGIRANLYNAYLSDANLSHANLSRANLYGANLYGANLFRANLSRADLFRANLSRADLSYANLSYANLSRADLSYANLSDANLSRANLSHAKTNERTRLPRFQIPQEGALIVYKKLRGGVARLEIPADARRTASVVGRKCRAEFARVLEAPTKGAVSKHDDKTVYVVGEIVRPDAYDPNPLIECAPGIHFFLTREEAKEY